MRHCKQKVPGQKCRDQEWHTGNNRKIQSTFLANEKKDHNYLFKKQERHKKTHCSDKILDQSIEMPYTYFIIEYKAKSGRSRRKNCPSEKEILG